MKKIYIAGCGGMLGEAFYKKFKKGYNILCTDKDINSSWLQYLDFRDSAAYTKDVIDYNPNYLFHIGAYTDLEFCELNPDDAYLTNTKSVETAVNISNSLNIPLLYISTAGIFNGKKSSYDDWAKPDPLGVYAKTKFEGEKFVIKNSSRYLICRAGWMMGGGPSKDKKFIQKLMKQIKEGSKELYIVNDKDGTPTYTHDFANNVKLLIEKEKFGLYNMVCGGQTSRLEVANELIKILGLDTSIEIIEVNSNHFKKEYFADRPLCERLVNAKLNNDNLNIMRDWKISLRDYIDKYYKDFL